jgi:proteasome accessory factor B
MGRKQSEPTRTERALRLLSLLATMRRQWGLEEMAQYLKCSKQTVRATLADLERSGLLELSEQRKDGKLFISARTYFEHSPLRLTAVDIQNLSFCRALVECILPNSIREEMDEIVPQFQSLLKDEKEKALAKALVVRVSALGTPVPPERIENVCLLIEALTTKRACRVTYQSLDADKPKTYNIAPREIFLYRDALYTVCSYVFDDGTIRNDYDDMTLAVHRIQDIEILEMTIPERPPRPKTPKRFGIISGKPFILKARFTGWAAVYVSERIWSDNQEITFEGDGKITLKIEAQSRPEALSWLLSFGSFAELLEPEDLKLELIQEIQKTLKLYGSSLQEER